MLTVKEKFLLNEVNRNSLGIRITIITATIIVAFFCLNLNSLNAQLVLLGLIVWWVIMVIRNHQVLLTENSQLIEMDEGDWKKHLF